VQSGLLLQTIEGLQDSDEERFLLNKSFSLACSPAYLREVFLFGALKLAASTDLKTHA
jgi:hypothetical protein